MTRSLARAALAPSLAAALAVSLLALASPAQAASCGLVTYADGTVGPAVCPDGQANEKVQAAFEKATPKVMALSSSPTRAQVRAAVCADRKSGASGTQLFDSVAYQSARYDWSRGLVHPVNRRLVAGRYC